MARTRIQLPSDGDASGRDLGDEEIALVVEALRSGTLTATKGTFVRRTSRRLRKQPTNVTMSNEPSVLSRK